MPNDIVLQLDPGLRNGRNSEATFVTLKSGRILLAWSKFNSDNHSDFGTAVIAARYSDDDGHTWSQKDQVLMAKDRGAKNIMSPSLLRLQDGRIALLFLRKEGMDQCIPFLSFSSDEAKTFSKPQRIIRENGYFVVNNDRLIQLASGRLIFPVSMHRQRGPWELKAMSQLPGDTNTQYPAGLDSFFACPGLILFYFSDDGGKTWLESQGSFYRCFSGHDGLEEPGMLELAPDKLWCWQRRGVIGEVAAGRGQWQAFSDDAGMTWSEPGPSQFISPCSPMQVKRIAATGDLLAVWNDQSGRFKTPPCQPISWARTPLVCAISKNQGKTWGNHLLLESSPDHGFCYPALHFAADGAALFSYNAGGAGSRNPLDTQRIRRVSLDSLYARAARRSRSTTARA